MPDITFNGPEGRLEGKYFQAKDPNSPIALVCHPHPQHGGTMNSKVAYRLYEAFARCGFNVLRFNFRGVGNSEGEFDNGLGELADAAAALDWLHSQHQHTPGIWISGFSFGAWIVMQLLMRRPDVQRFIAVSPSTSMHDFSFLSPCPATGLVMIGDEDEITPYQDVEEMLKKTTRQKGVTLHYSKVPGADHYYTDQQDILTQRLVTYIMQHHPTKQQAA
jgi:hypothetical protein